MGGLLLVSLLPAAQLPNVVLILADDMGWAPYNDVRDLRKGGRLPFDVVLMLKVLVLKSKNQSLQPFENRIKPNQHQLIMKNTKQPNLSRQNGLFRSALV
jgi:hypothetical protein